MWRRECGAFADGAVDIGVVEVSFLLLVVRVDEDGMVSALLSLQFEDLRYGQVSVYSWRSESLAVDALRCRHLGVVETDRAFESEFTHER